MLAPKDGRVRHDLERALCVFRDAVQRHRDADPGIDDLQSPLRVFCAEARRERMPPEQVLIRVKDALDGLSGFDDRPTDKQSARTRIISLAIETYYLDREDDGRSRL